MTAEFYLFDVGVGQAAALKSPNGKWCVFDVGKSGSFSPVSWIVGQGRMSSAIGSILTGTTAPTFHFFKATFSHYHGDHLGDVSALIRTGTDYFRAVHHDQPYLQDCYATCSYESKAIVNSAVAYAQAVFGSTWVIPDYGGVTIRELSLPVEIARGLGGDANSRVNNASIVTRIDVYSNSILICGDVEKEAWDAIIADQGEYGKTWRPFLSTIDIMVAPHHGHKSGYSIDLLNHAKPAVVLMSVQSKNPNVDSRYSREPVRGIRIGNDSYSYISTRQKGHIKISFEPPKTILGKGMQYWLFGDSTLN